MGVPGAEETLAKFAEFSGVGGDKAQQRVAAELHRDDGENRDDR
ncbi:hypothetical protein [Nonomuraea basaltis]|nr:hypothetical protein [Nonomuraea basaltis]